MVASEKPPPLDAPLDALGALAHRIARSAGADRDAAEELCRQLGPRLRVFLLRRERDHALAQDLTQDALLVLLDALASGRVDDPARVTAYALGVCRSLATSEGRKRERRRGLLEGIVERACAELPVLLRVELPRLGACFNQLPFRERQTLFETFMLERATDAIALTLSTTEGNVRVLRTRALAMLRRCLGIEKETR